jgi:acetyl coenzyme A synthetase (ADP forming)-like protein
LNSEVKNIVEKAKKEQRKVLTEMESKIILEQYGIPTPRQALATNIEEAARSGEEIGFPLVLKVVSPDIVHKSDAGCVQLNIQNVEELRSGFSTIIENAQKAKTDAKIEGISIQEMSPKGLEIIIGVKKDPVFGRVLLIGLGGVWVELLKDVSLRILPVQKEDIIEMFDELKGSTLLKGYRGSMPVDIDALADIIFKVSRIVEDIKEIGEMDLNPVFAYPSGEGAVAVDARIILSDETPTEEKDYDWGKIISAARAMLNPRTIAIIGASADLRKNSGRLISYLIKHGYDGKVFPINPKEDEISGYKCYKNIKDVPDKVDLACIIIPAKGVLQAVKDCTEKGVNSAIIFTSGFAEVGAEGKKIQEEIVNIARKNNLRLCGPNTMGVVNPVVNTCTAFGMAFESSKPQKGELAFITQSGAIGSALLSRAWEQGIGFSRWIATGNEADMEVSDFIAFLAQDEHTKVISIFMEGVNDGNKFVEAVKMANKNHKPIIVYKTGRSDVGQKAVQSHTGSLAGDDAVYDAVFKQYGIIRVTELQSLYDVAAVLALQPIPKGKNVGVVSTSGGACSVIADECELIGLKVAKLSPEAEAKISKVIPPFGSAKNPIDVTAQFLRNPEYFSQTLEVLLEEETVDIIYVQLTTSADPPAFEAAKAIVKASKARKKPIIVSRMGAEVLAPKSIAHFRENKIPLFATPDRAIEALRVMASYAGFSSKNH